VLRVAIVGCGRIADAHVGQIRRISGCEIVGVCDREGLMARQLDQRYRTGGWFDDLDQLLDRARPDVVHVTTPPESHFAIALACLERGRHVYVEKPLTLDAGEAAVLVRVAESRGLGLTVGHDAQFSHAARRLRALVRAGYLGDRVVHMASYYGYDLGDATYARTFLGDTGHWVRRLPGGLLQNVMSHGIARLTEFLSDEALQVTAHAFTSPSLRRLGGGGVLDELRATMVDGEDRTAFFSFSTTMRPSLYQFGIFGTENGLLLDEYQQTVIALRGRPFKSYLERFVPPVVFARQYLGNAIRNVRLFLARDFHMESGKKALFEAFYQAIRDGGPMPIPYPELLRTARVMDAIVQQIAAGAPAAAAAAGRARC
jgi:predicted dehydrogenase